MLVLFNTMKTTNTHTRVRKRHLIIGYVTRFFLPCKEILDNESSGTTVWYDPFSSDVYALGVCLYAMSFRTYPYQGDDTAMLRKSEKAMRVTFNLRRKQKHKDEVLDPLSPQSRNIIRNMLEADPRRRITMAGIWTHPWIHLMEEKEAKESV